ncbi:MAG: hypothetical protein RLZZ28_2031 [Bacteroidota bacterium]|jgi:YaiO family outer membrane protein
MFIKKIPLLILSTCFLITGLGTAFAQDTTSSDGLLIEAKKAAFEKNDYEQAKKYLHKALKISPDYADIRIFLGRIHSWTKNYDSAKYYFNSVLLKTPDYEDASSALTDLEYWNNHNEAALQVCTEGLKFHPAAEPLLIKKAKILNDMRRYAEADITVHEAIQINPKNPESRALSNRIRGFSSLNQLGISYDYETFDKQFDAPWHLVALDYRRITGIGSVIGRVNYSNRFKESGTQFEVDAYPHISKTFYAYVNLGFSDNVGVFPNWRGGFSLNANLPGSFEADLGFRYLKFSGDPTWIYTAYLGKYVKSWLFGLRTYITPSTFASTASTSFTASARYYYASPDDLIGLAAGYGISPDDRQNSIQLEATPMKSYRASVLFRKKLSPQTVLISDFGWANTEYLPNTKGNQYQISIGWLYRF